MAWSWVWEFEIMKITEALNQTESQGLFPLPPRNANSNENFVLSLTHSREGELAEGLLECFHGNVHFFWFTPAFSFPDPNLGSWRWGWGKRPAAKTAGPGYTHRCEAQSRGLPPCLPLPQAPYLGVAALGSLPWVSFAPPDSFLRTL